ncbi:MAG: hypothetical protein JNK74_11270 [Candidatus Hydrogenedentes bacterium]|nr:hypothetical protein [Candidatus Hydrogenedentota bacterium]
MQATETTGLNDRKPRESRGRKTRLWLLALLMLTALLAGGLLLAKYQLAVLRGRVQTAIEERTGIQLETTGVQVHGVAGLRLQELHLAYAAPAGPAIDIAVPEALLHVSLLELLRGSVVLDRLQLDNAHVRLSRPVDHKWITDELTSRSALTSNIPFRALGRNCTLEIDRIVGESTFRVEHVNFDLNRLSDSPHIIANVDGRLDQASRSAFEVFARYASLEDFDLRLQSDGLTAQDVAAFLPTATDLFTSGSVRPSLRVAGYPRKAMVVSLELPFNNVALATPQRFPVPSEGLLTALASYDVNTRLLTLNSAKTLSPDFEGRVEGTVSLAQDLPDLDLKVEVQQLPVNDVLDFVMKEWLAQYGSLEIDAPKPYKFFVTLNGQANNARLGVEAQLGNGALRFAPTDPALPRADLKFSLMSVAWNSEQSFPTGTLSLSGGSIEHGPSKLHAEDISGNFQLGSDGLVFDPMVARIAGNTVMGSAHYQLAEKTLNFSIAGNLGTVEELEFFKSSRSLNLYGPLALDALTGTIAPGHHTYDATVDLTRTGIEWEWWFKKAPGIGARLEKLHFDLKPGKSATLSMLAALDTIEIDTRASLTHRGGKWALDDLKATSPNVSMGTANKVLVFPYAISGGTGTEAYLHWVKKSQSPEVIELTIGGLVDELALLPEGSRQPITGKNVRVDTTVVKAGEERTGLLTLHTTSAELPPFGTRWLLPPRAEDDPSLKTYPPLDRDWTYTLSADTLVYPPWRGSAFTGRAYTRKHESGFERFEATVDNGKIGGVYSSSNPDNINRLNASWDDVPASHLLEHLKLPEIFTGTMTGGIQYSIDQDDSGTLAGTGYFDVVDGQFSADYLFSKFQQQIEQGTVSIPPSLRFSRFASDLTLEGDVVKATNMILESEAVTISGDGQFVLSGDMDFHLKFSLPPDTAKGIPALRTYFNLDGLKRSQTNLQIAFHIFGPTFNPKMELDGMPSMGDTIVSGAVEVTSDVMKVVDLPRQILLDLFKIGGGIVGAGGKKAPNE